MIKENHLASREPGSKQREDFVHEKAKTMYVKTKSTFHRALAFVPVLL
jgi:hypothetical protein